MIKERSPETPIVMLTGFGAALTQQLDDVDVVASKPIALAELRSVIAHAMRWADRDDESAD